MTPEDVARVATTANAVRDDEDAVAAFYARLFASAPEVRAMFPADLAAQQLKFAAELDALVLALGDLDAFERRARVLGARHRGYGVRAVHYPLVREALVATLAERVPDFGEDERAAWVRGMTLVAEVMLEGAERGATQPSRADPRPRG